MHFITPKHRTKSFLCMVPTCSRHCSCHGHTTRSRGRRPQLPPQAYARLQDSCLSGQPFLSTENHYHFHQPAQAHPRGRGAAAAALLPLPRPPRPPRPRMRLPPPARRPVDRRSPRSDSEVSELSAGSGALPCPARLSPQRPSSTAGPPLPWPLAAPPSRLLSPSASGCRSAVAPAPQPAPPIPAAALPLPRQRPQVQSESLLAAAANAPPDTAARSFGGRPRLLNAPSDSCIAG